MMVGLGRVELPTYGLGNRRSIHLSYSPISPSPKFNMHLGRARNNLDIAEFPTAANYLQQSIPKNEVLFLTNLRLCFYDAALFIDRTAIPPRIATAARIAVHRTAG